MPTFSPPATRRDVLGGAAAFGAASLVSGPALAAVTGGEALRPFKVAIPESALSDMRRRILDTRWADAEPVADASQDVQRAQLQVLMRYWAGGYDWRKLEARLNVMPMYTTRIDGLEVHFIHVRSRHQGAMPMIMTHGWPVRSWSSSRSSTP